jgi:outer membrane protein OmpA-like peptidoglycan-associated protein
VAGLAAVIADIKGRQLGGITVAGYTDTSGAAEYNMQLSQRRANTVATELIKAGVPAQLISTEGYGQTALAVPTADGVELAANRRVVIDFAP